MNYRAVAIGMSLAALISLNAQAKFAHVATHPEANRTFHKVKQAPGTFQLSHRGREIKVLRAYNNKLYIGYGQDDGPNLPGSCVPYYVNPLSGAPWCPIVIRYFDPASRSLSGPQGYLRSQQLSTLENLDGSLFGLAEDQEGADDYVKCTRSGCRGGAIGVEKPAHLYSATALNGVIYMAGSIGSDGGIWKSRDNGAHWSETLRIPSVAGGKDFSRIHDVGGPYKGKLYAHPRDWYRGYQPLGKTYNGNSSNVWANQARRLESFFPTFRKREFAGKLVYIEAQTLKEFDGTSIIRNYNSHVLDFTISGDWLYVLNSASGRHDVMRTKDLRIWHKVDTAPGDAISLEVVADSVYVGTKNARIFKSNASLDEPDTIVITPVIFSLLLSD